jgi:hypothetical protein
MAAGLRIRMYRTGFGDCFLLSFGPASRARHVLIDFGAHMHGEIGTMGAIMDDIEKETKRTLELVVASHAHRDHISGFGAFARRFSDFTIGEVWMPWTDSNEPDAVALQRKQLALYDRLETHLRLALGAGEASPSVAAALEALANLRGNEPAKTALANGFDAGATVKYLRGGDAIAKVGRVPGLSARILGPPKDTAFFSRMDPPSDQRFLTSGTDTSGVVRPFARLEIRPADPELDALVREGQPLVPAGELARLKDLAEAPADRLALALDNVRNNTSLVILFRYKGRSLLFPGDAQWGNWQSWIGADDAHQLLGDLDFMKVSHHGSENATPVDVVHALRASGVAAMVSTQGKPFPTIPRMPLLAELEKHCAVVVRSDWIDVAGAPAGPKPRPRFPRGYAAGALWVDYKL